MLGLSLATGQRMTKTKTKEIDMTTKMEENKEDMTGGAAKNTNPDDVKDGLHIGGENGGASKTDVKELLEKVRKEEKSKLYPQIDHLKKSVEQLQKQNELLVNQLSSVQEDEKKKGEAKLTETQLIQKQMQEITRQNAVLQAQLTTMQEESQKAITIAQLDAYRTRKIAESGGELIPELVFGESEAEIDAAIIASKQRYIEIRASVKASLKQNMKETSVPPVGGTPPSDAVSGRQNAEELTAEMIANMPVEQWAKERQGIRRQIDAQMKDFFRRGPR